MLLKYLKREFYKCLKEVIEPSRKVSALLLQKQQEQMFLKMVISIIDGVL